MSACLSRMEPKFSTANETIIFMTGWIVCMRFFRKNNHKHVEIRNEQYLCPKLANIFDSFQLLIHATVTQLGSGGIAPLNHQFQTP